METTTSELGSTMVQSPGHYLSRGRSMPEWASYSVEEASERTGYNREYLRRLIRKGKIEAVKIGPAYLIRVESLERYLQEIEDPGDARTGPRRKGK